MRHITTYEAIPPRPATKKQTGFLRWQPTFKTKEKREHQAAICKIANVQETMLKGEGTVTVIVIGDGGEGGGTQELVCLVITGSQIGTGRKAVRRRPTLDSLLIQEVAQGLMAVSAQFSTRVAVEMPVVVVMIMMIITMMDRLRTGRSGISGARQTRKGVVPL